MDRETQTGSVDSEKGNVTSMLYNLSPKQTDILRYLGLGLCRKQIAERVNITVKGVDHHILQIESKVGKNGTAALVRFAVDNNFVTKGERMPEKKAIVLSPVHIKNTDDLSDILLKAASDAASGNVDPVRVNALCQLTTTLIELARFKIELAEHQGK